MLMPEEDMYYINPITGKKVPCNRFNMLSNLSQHYYVDQLSRQVDPRLDHQRYLNRTYFKKTKGINNSDNSDSDDESEDSDSDDENTRRRTILGESITGSHRHLKKLSLNAMHIVSELDKPHIFLTLTCNSEWPEIKERIGKDQTAFDRPDITTMVFHQRLEALLYNLANGKYFKFTIDISMARQYMATYDSSKDIYTGAYNDLSQFHNDGKLEQSVENFKVVYDGHWNNGIRHGFGILKQPFSVTFSGEFKNDIPNGNGTLLIQRSKYYDNDCKVLYGSASIVFSKLDIDSKSYTLESYTGNWENGILYLKEEDGKTRRIQYDGVIFHGFMDSQNIANGEGCLLFPDGTTYNEVFIDNKAQVTNKVQYHMKVIEYQHRGLPHCHYVARLTNMPKAECMLVQWINENISTKGFEGFNNSNKDSSEYLLKEIIRNKMQHKCSDVTKDNPRGCRLEDKVTCKKFYHATVESDTAFFDSSGFPKYKRAKGDLKIVPYNPLICLDWDGHANTEFTGLSYAIMYLYKYIFKGNTKVQVSVTGGKNDEIQYYLKTRKICSMDAVNRFFGYPTYPQPFPTVKPIKVKLPDQMDLILYENKLCSLFIYFNRPESMKKMTYIDFFTKYTYVRKTDSKKRKAVDQFYTKRFSKIVTHPTEKTQKKITIEVIIKERKRSSSLIRLQGLSIKSGEICYLRMLLKHKAAKSYEDLYTFDGIRYTTFQESAKKHGLLKDMEFLKEEFLEIFQRVLSCEKRRMHYAIWLGQDYPINFMFNDGKFCSIRENNKNHEGYLYKEMVHDWIKCEIYSPEQIKNKFLTEIDKYLSDIGQDITTYGLPKPLEIRSEVDYELSKYDRATQLQRYEQLEIAQPSNLEQKEFLERFKHLFHIVQSNDEHAPVLIFLTGSGGTGKSCVLEKVAAFVRSEGCICKVSAATALAASIYSDATTFHSLAKIPVVEQCDRELEYSVTLKLTQERTDLLLKAKVIIIDEVFFSHRECLEAFYYCERLNGLKGKIILTAGDRKQLLPIAEGGTKHDQLAIVLSSSELWSLFKNNIFELKQNMRLSDTRGMSEEELEQQINYANTLEDIGNQTSKYTKVTKDDSCSDDEQIYHLHCVHKFVVKNLAQTEEVLDDSLNWLYESGFNEDSIKSSAVIVGTNKLVDMWNKKIQQRNTNDDVLLTSTDYLADIDDDKNYIKEMLTTQVLNRRNHASAPPHELRLKVGDICILTRYILYLLYTTI